MAEKYKANAIPQTVVIDREGNVFRLFVGGGPYLGDQLREAIQATTQCRLHQRKSAQSSSCCV